MVRLVSADPLAVANDLRPVLLRLARAIRREAEDLGVTTTQTTLMWLVRHNPGVTLRALAAEEGISPPALSGHVDRLERLGLVERVRDEGDRRRVALSLTDEGDRLLRRIRARRTAWLSARLRDLEPEELERIEAALPALERLLGDDL